MQPMRTTALIVFLLSAIAVAASAGDPPKPWTGSAETAHFGANLFLVSDLKTFMTQWEKPGDIARIDMVSSVAAGRSVEAVILFWGCQASSDTGNCQLFAETSVLSTDGTPLGGGPPKPIWTKPPPASGLLSLGETTVSLAPAGDPAALQVQTIVTDRVSGKSVKITVPLEYR